MPGQWPQRSLRGLGSPDPQSPQNLLLIDNSLKTPNYTTGWAKWANVGIVEDLSDIDTIVGAQAPYDPNNPTQNWKQVTASQWGWYKWFHARGCCRRPKIDPLKAGLPIQN